MLSIYSDAVWDHSAPLADRAAVWLYSWMLFQATCLKRCVCMCVCTPGAYTLVCGEGYWWQVLSDDCTYLGRGMFIDLTKCSILLTLSKYTWIYIKCTHDLVNDQIGSKWSGWSRFRGALIHLGTGAFYLWRGRTRYQEVGQLLEVRQTIPALGSAGVIQEWVPRGGLSSVKDQQ